MQIQINNKLKLKAQRDRKINCLKVYYYGFMNGYKLVKFWDVTCPKSSTNILTVPVM